MTPIPQPIANGHLRREEALDWFVRRQQLGLEASEEQAFQAWLLADPLNQAAFAQWQAQWQSYDAIPPEMRALLQRNLAYDQAMEAASGSAREAIQSGHAPQPPASGASTESSVRTGPSRRRVLLPALSLLAVAAGGIAWKQWQAQPSFEQSWASKRGQQLELTLPDGTRLRLDASTQLEVRYFRQRREVRLLEGQAIFEVAANTEAPFDVLAGPLRVTVVGTRFAVRYTPSLPGDAGVRVAVEEGRVQVAQAGHEGQRVLLAAGEQVHSDGNGVLAAVRPVALAEVAPWRNQRVIFDNQRLDMALAELGRYADVPLVIHDPAVAALKITGVFDPGSLATFRRILPASLPVRLQAIGQEHWEIVMR